MFNLNRQNKIRINHISLTQRNYLPKYIPLKKINKPDFIYFFYMTLGIIITSFIYYIKL